MAKSYLLLLCLFVAAVVSTDSEASSEEMLLAAQGITARLGCGQTRRLAVSICQDHGNGSGLCKGARGLVQLSCRLGEPQEEQAAIPVSNKDVDREMRALTQPTKPTAGPKTNQGDASVVKNICRNCFQEGIERGQANAKCTEQLSNRTSGRKKSTKALAPAKPSSHMGPCGGGALCSAGQRACLPGVFSPRAGIQSKAASKAFSSNPFAQLGYTGDLPGPSSWVNVAEQNEKCAVDTTNSCAHKVPDSSCTSYKHDHGSRDDLRDWNLCWKYETRPDWYGQNCGRYGQKGKRGWNATQVKQYQNSCPFARDGRPLEATKNLKNDKEKRPSERFPYSDRRKWSYQVPVWINGHAPECPQGRTSFPDTTKQGSERCSKHLKGARCVKACPNSETCPGPCSHTPLQGSAMRQGYTTFSAECKCYDGALTKDLLLGAVTKRNWVSTVRILLSMVAALQPICKSCEKVPATVGLEHAKDKPGYCTGKNIHVGCSANCRHFCPADPHHYQYFHKFHKTQGLSSSTPSHVISEHGESPEYACPTNVDEDGQPMIRGEAGGRCRSKKGEKPFFFHPAAKRNPKITPMQKALLDHTGLCIEGDAEAPKFKRELYSKGNKHEELGELLGHTAELSVHLRNHARAESRAEAREKWGRARKLAKKAKAKVKKVAKAAVKGVKGLAMKGVGKLVQKLWKKISKILERRGNWYVNGKKTMHLGDLFMKHYFPILDKFAGSGMKNLKQWVKKEMVPQVQEAWARTRLDMSRQMAIGIMRTLSPGYTCTECGPRFAGDAIIEKFCAEYLEKISTMSQWNIVFPDPDTNAPGLRMMIGSVPTTTAFEKGKNGGQFATRVGKLGGYSPYTNAKFQSFYNIFQDAYDGIDPWKDTDCLMKFEYNLKICSTCCCKEGYVSGGGKFALVKDTRGKNCKPWFTTVESLIRAFMGMWQTTQITLAFGRRGRCF